MSPLRPAVWITTIAFLCLGICLPQIHCQAQDGSKISFGKVTPADFQLPSSPIIDSNANAVTLSDIGSVSFVGNKRDWFSYVYKRRTRIKILNKKALQAATVTYTHYSPGDDPQKFDKVEGSTYNFENGQVIETKMDKKDIFENREDQYYVQEKFTLPGAREGSIIEYTYTVTSEYTNTMPEWHFQSLDYPSLWSEYNVSIPQALFYVVIRQGFHPYAVDKGSEGHEMYKVTEKAESSALGMPDKDMYVSATTTNHRWAMKDIPAFHEERFLSTPRNYVDKIAFQLSKTYNGQEYSDVSNNWKKVTEELMSREQFGLPLKEEGDWLEGLADKITAGHDDLMEKARAIYYYVKDHFTCTDQYDMYITTSLRDVVKKSSGSVGDINLLLIALLRRKGLLADPVVLSTREVGFNLATYPVLAKLNYVIAQLQIDGKKYYLDAAHPQLGFGQMAGDCYNGHARVISFIDSASVFFEPDSLKERKTTMVIISSTDKGLEGTYVSTLGLQESYNTREAISNRGETSYFKNIQTAWGEDMDIVNPGIDSLNRPEDPIQVHYDFILKQSPGATIIYLNPLLGEGWRENPFKAADRKYPVEMPYCRDDNYVFSMEIPEGYMVDELPKSARVALNGDQGLFEYLVDAQSGRIQMRCRLKLNRAYFAPEDYGNLRDFFGFIVKKENETIVLKKK